MIELQGIGKTYYTNEIATSALDNINITIAKGEFVSIMGPSGSGKSTLLNIMGLLDYPTVGRVIIDGQDTSAMNDRRMSAFRNQQLSFIFQSFHLVPSLSVADNVELPLVYRGMRAAERRRIVADMLRQVGLSHRANNLPTQISGGQCQRVAIARALACHTNIILADEPTGNLDSHMGIEVMGMLRDINQTNGTTIVMVTHNEEQALQSNRIIRLFDGRQVE